MILLFYRLTQEVAALLSQASASENSVATLTELVNARESELVHSHQSVEELKEEHRIAKERMMNDWTQQLEFERNATAAALDELRALQSEVHASGNVNIERDELRVKCDRFVIQFQTICHF